MWEMQWQPWSSIEPFKPKWILPAAFKCACLCPLSNVGDVGNVKAQQVACHYRAQDGLTGLDQPHDWITSSSGELCVCESVCSISEKIPFWFEMLCCIILWVCEEGMTEWRNSEWEIESLICVSEWKSYLRLRIPSVSVFTCIILHKLCFM